MRKKCIILDQTVAHLALTIVASTFTCIRIMERIL